MLNIYKLIEHLVHNLVPLNEYSEGTMKKIIEKFKEEADDKNIEISDKLLTKYIQQFDNMKNSPSISEKDIMKWPLQKLMRTVASSVKDEEDEEWDPGQDVMYDKDGIVVWNGNTEDRCIRFAKGETPWCIARGSYATYHMDPDRGYPVFYLLRNTNLDDSDDQSESYDQSFVALQVRNPDKYSDGNNYVYTLRKNYPYESNRKSWEEVIRDIPWINDIPNVKELLKYVPPSKAEMESETSVNVVRARQFQLLPYDKKQTYLRKRTGSDQIVSDLINSEFIKRYVATDNKLGQWFAQNPSVGRESDKLINIESFSKTAQNSIVANLRQDYKADRFLFTDKFPWNLKKLITYKGKWEAERNTKIFVTADKESIVVVKAEIKPTNTTVKLGLVTEFEEHENIKVNKNTIKLLKDFPLETDEDKALYLSILPSLNGLDPDIDKEILKVLKDTLTQTTIDGLEVYYDPKTFRGYKVEFDGNLVKVDPTDIVNALPEEEKSSIQTAIQEDFKRELRSLNSLSRIELISSLPPDVLYDAVEALPYAERTRSDGTGYDGTMLVSRGSALMFIPEGPYSTRTKLAYGNPYRGSSDYMELSGTVQLDPASYKIYLEYLRNTNEEITHRDLERLLDDLDGDKGPLVALLSEYAPDLFSASANDKYKLVVDEDSNRVYFLDLNSSDRSKSFPLDGNGDRRSVPSDVYNRLTAREEAPPQETDDETEPQSQRPVRNTNTQQVGDLNITAETIQDYITNNIGTSYNNLPRAVKQRLDQGAQRVSNDERGARRRNQLLGDRGQVTTVLRLAGRSSAGYVLALTNGDRLISIALQPGNIQGIIHAGGFSSMASINDLVATLDNNNLSEDLRQVYIREFLATNPSMKNEVKAHLQKVLAEKKKIKTNPIEALIREAVVEVLNKK